MAEQIVNSAQSTLNGTITNVAATLTVANGAVFPASGNFRILVDSELMLCTARAGNVLTVTRGIEATTAVGHTTGVLVTHVATVAGLTQFIAEHAISQTIADAKGDIIAATGADVLVRKAVGADKTVLMADSSQSDGLNWTGGIWAAYTPVWTSTGTAPALGNGTLVGRFVQIGKTVMGWAVLTIGSTTTFGTGSYFFSLPVAADTTAANAMGTYRVLDASVPAVFNGFVLLNTGTTVFLENTLVPPGNVGNTSPMTWATTDKLSMRFAYEAA